MSLQGNVGEWSEVYVLLALVSAGTVQIVDEEFRPTGSTLGLVAVERGDSTNLTTFRPDLKKGRVKVVGGGELAIVDISTLELAADSILRTLQNSKGRISIPEVETLLAKLRILKLAASSASKSDLRIIVQDSKTTSRLDLPMSIKSLMGQPPSLLNASGATNFSVRFSCGEDLRNELLLLGRNPKKVIQRLGEASIPLHMEGPVNEVFRSNLQLSDSAMPAVLSALVLAYYSGSSSDLVDLVERVIENDPVNVGAAQARRFYTTKLRMFLSDAALGMKPSAPWDGKHAAGGGYLVVKPSGEVVCLYAVDRERFRDYLVNNTRLETGDTKRHGFGQVEDCGDGSMRILLNLQVRFRPVGLA